MAVAFDTASESHGGTTGSTNEASFEWTHTPVGTPKAVLVFIRCNDTPDPVTAVSYGGVALSKPPGTYAEDTAGEPGTMQAWFLGSGIPTGAQTVHVDRTNNATNVYGMAITSTALTDTEIYLPGIVIVQGDTALVEQNVDDGSPGTNSMRYAGLSSGLGTANIAGANSQNCITIDFGATVACSAREKVAGQGSRPVGYDYSGTPDDTAFVGLAVREIPVGGAKPKPLMMMGVG